MVKRKLPIGGVQAFNKLREEYEVYVDKTKHIYEMATRYGVVFLSRPRRFGKSLLCSTIKALFQNRKELFEGLAISKTDWKWNEHPVIHIDFASGNYTADNGVDVLKDTINSQLNEACDIYGISVGESEFISNRLRRIVVELSKKMRRVVIVIDEYDYPLLCTIDQPELNRALREELKGFYSVFKGCDEFLQLVFITGITKFAQISLFSGMNQAIDISMMQDYIDICGITQNELETYFKPEIDFYAERYGGREKYLSRLEEFYNGYYFTETKLSVYNPYGILHHFNNDAKFTPYWSLSGSPTFVMKYLEMKGIDFVDVEEAVMEAGKFANYKDNDIVLYPLLYQAGYLTISDYDEDTGFYQLNYPNIEVRKTFAEFLASNYSEAEKTLNNSISKAFVRSLQEGDIEKFMNLLKWYLQTVDYSLSSKITEHYFEFAVSNIINMLGFDCKNEVHTANGSMDTVILTRERIYIFEFKVDKPVEKALWQIDRKDYALFYANDGREIVKVGVIFSRELRNIVEWGM